MKRAPKTQADVGERGSQGSGVDVRCTCGNLVARWVNGRVELKCRRCKRRIYLSAPPREEGARDPP